MGVTGLETAFAALHTGLVLPGTMDLALLVERMTAGGEPIGLPIPRIDVGAPANVCLIDPDAEWEVGESGYESRSANCAFAGRRLTGRVRMTIAAGTVAYRERTFALERYSAAATCCARTERWDGEAVGAENCAALGRSAGRRPARSEVSRGRSQPAMSCYQSGQRPRYAGSHRLHYPLIGHYGVAAAHMGPIGGGGGGVSARVSRERGRRTPPGRGGGSPGWPTAVSPALTRWTPRCWCGTSAKGAMAAVCSSRAP